MPAVKNGMQLMVTRRCHLRCTYCPVQKRDADMSPEAADRAVDFLFTSPARELRLDFTGGEPFLRFDTVRRAVLRAEKLAVRLGKKISFYAVTNGIELDDEKTAFLAARPFLMELSLDGDRATHNRFKKTHLRGLDAYACTAAAIKKVRAAGIKHFAVMVAAPESAAALAYSFEHAYSLGVRSFDINYAIGRMWDSKHIEFFKRSFATICLRHGAELRSGELNLGNFSKRCEPALLNSEIMADADGSLHMMSEWLFERVIKGASPPFGLGSVFDKPRMADMGFGRAAAYYTLLKMYGGNRKLRGIIVNNVSAGLEIGAFVAQVKAKVCGGGR
jgi:MoaA/NifB/PqqE/SkfB family radical SAM enzyme